MVTLTYLHNHECSHQGEELVLHPEVRAGAYFRPTPICVETGVELLLVGEGVRV